MPNLTTQHLAALMLNSALDRAFAAADLALAGRTGIDIEVFLAEEHLVRLDPANLPPVAFLVCDTGPGCSRRGKLSSHEPTGAMARTLKSAVAEVVAEGKRMESEAAANPYETDVELPAVVTTTGSPAR
jgi:hypothetical protein